MATDPNIASTFFRGRRRRALPKPPGPRQRPKVVNKLVKGGGLIGRPKIQRPKGSGTSGRPGARPAPTTPPKGAGPGPRFAAPATGPSLPPGETITPFLPPGLQKRVAGIQSARGFTPSRRRVGPASGPAAPPPVKGAGPGPRFALPEPKGSGRAKPPRYTR